MIILKEKEKEIIELMKKYKLKSLKVDTNKTINSEEVKSYFIDYNLI